MVWPTTTRLEIQRLLQLLLLHPFNGLFSRTNWVSRYQKDKTSLDLNETRDDGVWGCSGISWTIMQTICTLLQTDNHTNTSSLSFYRPDALPDAQPTASRHWRQRETEREWDVATGLSAVTHSESGDHWDSTVTTNVIVNVTAMSGESTQETFAWLIFSHVIVTLRYNNLQHSQYVF